MTTTQGETDDNYSRLILAIVAQALRDARRNNHEYRREAVAWLKSGQASMLLAMTGKRITQRDIDKWLDRLLPPPKRKPVRQMAFGGISWEMR